MRTDVKPVTTAQDAAATGRPLDVGFFGKLPSHGDFLRRRVGDAFVGVWDGWLQECLAASREILGPRWLDVYLTSPAWRFVCAAGATGPAPVIGLMVPSVDRVGRYFPLTLVAELPRDASLIDAAAESATLLDGLEQLVLETLEADHVDVESFDERLLKLGYQLGSVGAPPAVVLDTSAASLLADAAQGNWQLPLASPQQLSSAFAQILASRLSALYDPLALWWTQGSSVVVPSCLVTRGLPDPEMYVSLLDGSWPQRRWRSVPALVGADDRGNDTLIDDLTPPRLRSAAASDVGRVREINEDAFLERPDAGLWVVADGLGGHSDGEVASRMVCDALADWMPEGGLDEMVSEIRRRIGGVNDHLLRAATREIDPVRSGSTVVALLVRGSRCSVLWAGDSRVYRLREGVLEQLTRDHSLAETEVLIGGEAAHAITRAVGAEATLALDLHQSRVRVGDRFLLCSDGLTRSVPEAMIRGLLERPDIRDGADGLVRATLDAGAPDNVTVLVVEAFG